MGNSHFLKLFYSHIFGRHSRSYECLPQRIEPVHTEERQSAEPEWGLHFVEGVCFISVLLVVVVGLAISIGCGVAAGILKKDVGSGVGWGAFSAGILTILATLVALSNSA